MNLRKIIAKPIVGWGDLGDPIARSRCWVSRSRVQRRRLPHKDEPPVLCAETATR